ncbi:hypothetical protein [Actinoplanes sp. NPDC051859]|uniref:hypothetical protein n=1 Tax=Actinoplanes sp. NPDC051859 TaxID=3363909 RepID=UPI0037B7DA99
MRGRKLAFGLVVVATAVTAAGSGAVAQTGAQTTSKATSYSARKTLGIVTGVSSRTTVLRVPGVGRVEAECWKPIDTPTAVNWWVFWVNTSRRTQDVGTALHVGGSDHQPETPPGGAQLIASGGVDGPAQDVLPGRVLIGAQTAVLSVAAMGVVDRARQACRFSVQVLT